MGARRAAADETRARIVTAARAVLAGSGGIGAFTVDAIAQEAGVARMTVYHQFRSKTGLIDAVFDSLAIARVGVARLTAALALDDPEDTLAEFVGTFAEAWQEDRQVIRRLRGLAALDPEFARIWEARESRRRDGLRQIVTRVAKQRRRGLDIAGATAALYAIVAFETFDAMAGTQQRFEHVAPTVLHIARGVLALPG
jgi:AcrR family transcriptional regulator